MTDTKRDILPEEHVRPATFGSLATLLVMVVLLVAGANALASYTLKRMPINRGYALAYGKWTLMERALAEKKPVDVLIVGDSSSNQGLNPTVIQSETGRGAINLGVVAEALTVAPVWTVERYLDQSSRNGTPPRTVLWMHVYDVWSRVDKNDRRLRGISGSLPSQAWPYINRGPKVRFSTNELALTQRLPLYFQNVSLASLIRRPLASAAEARRFDFDEFGFTSETVADPALVRRDTRNHQGLVRDNPFEMTTLSRRSIDAMGQLTAKHGVEVWIVQSPLCRRIWEDEVFRTRWYEVRDALRKAIERYPHLHVTFDEPVLFDDNQMQNCDHVLVDAANEFTRQVIGRAALKTPSTRPAVQPRKRRSE